MNRPVATKEQIREKGVQQLASINPENDAILHWKMWLANYQFDAEYSDDGYVWLTCVLALKGVNTGNAGIGGILIDDSGMVHKMEDMPPFLLDLSKRQVFGQANCSQDLINASNQIFLLNIEELSKKTENRTVSS